jgi:hypothetical protein
MAPPTATAAAPTRRHVAASVGGGVGGVSSAAPSRRAGRPADAPSTRHAPLRVVPNRTRRGLRGRRAAAGRGRLLAVVSVSMIVVALLAVVVGQAILANGQVKLTALQDQLALEQSAHRQAELSVAQLETPARIVGAAEGQGHMVHQTAIELPYVSLSVPLPTPKVTPAPAAPPTTSAGAGAPTGAAGGSTSTSTSSSTAATSTPSSTP